MKTQVEVKQRKDGRALVVITNKKGRQFYCVYARPSFDLPDDELCKHAIKEWEDNPRADFTPYYGGAL